MLIPALTFAAGIGATISGVVGMAGGTFLLALMILLGVTNPILIPLHAAVQFISNIARVVAHRDHIRWKPFLVLALVATPCPIIGLQIVDHLDFEITKQLMGALILYAAWAPKRNAGNLSERASFGLAGFLGGTLGVVVGAVGPLIAPFFLRSDMKKSNIIATKALCQAYLHIIKIIAFSSIGVVVLEKWSTFIPMAAATVVGTYIGKWFLGRIDETKFRLLYKIVLTGLAIRLILGAFF